MPPERILNAPTIRVRLASATVIAAAIGFSIRVFYGESVLPSYIQPTAQAGRLDAAIAGSVPAHEDDAICISSPLVDCWKAR